jgi:hypothetical protein
MAAVFTLPSKSANRSQTVKANVAPITAATSPKIANQPKAVRNFVHLGPLLNGREKMLNFWISSLVVLIMRLSCDARIVLLMRIKLRLFDIIARGTDG